ncbi:MAG: glycogen/starch/alpha-glucan phosphorylase [Rhizobiaceae bacterium]
MTRQTSENARHPAGRSVTAAHIVDKLKYEIGKDPSVATNLDWLHATIMAVRDPIIDAWMESVRETWKNGDKRVYYLSLEFLVGRLLRDAISNLGALDNVKTALSELGVDFGAIFALEPDAALGNGGLGRLAACYMESMASVGVPAHGYGIRYQNGMFRQEIADGWQAELPETWLVHGNPWEFERAEAAYEVGFGGHVEAEGEGEALRHVWVPAERVDAVAYDTPVVGWRANRVNTLRLWQARPVDPIRLEAFNAGDYAGALEESNKAEMISRVLYPADSHKAGQELRLRQEYFFSSASLQDILRRHHQRFKTFANLADKVAIQLNDTHPAIAVAELMRLLSDHHGMEWRKAWETTRAVFAYTNHTLLPEALETWPVPLMERMLPRHMQIIYRINADTLQVARIERGMSDEHIRAISLIDENGERRVRMGQLAFVGSHSVNGVSALHTELMKKTVFADLHHLFPGRINNKTNGITPRRWLFQCNPGLVGLARATIGEAFLDDIGALDGLLAHAGDAAFLEAFARVKRENKARLSNRLREHVGIALDPDAMFDIQIKRIHEYKRQLLNILETIALYDQIRSHPEKDWTPRVKIFAGKAAPSYWMAKVIIKLINDVARVINADPAVRGLLKIVFVPNYNVSYAEIMVPAADLSEQISTAGMEASGTGNMKFALNGALTIGTMDGANVEIREHVGPDNIFIFGLEAEDVERLRRNRQSPRAVIENSPELRQALDAIAAGVFSRGDTRRYADLVQNLYDHDWFMVARDFDAYAARQREVDAAWTDRRQWNRMAVTNTARMGYFSSDRAIREYARDIWNAGPGART